MDGNSLLKIRDLLMDRRQRIGSDLDRDREAGASGQFTGSQVEMIDMAQTLEQLDRDKSLMEQERRELILIDRALEKITAGTFGICEECEEEIPMKRLMAVPQARFCTQCQTSEERLTSRNRFAAAA